MQCTGNETYTKCYNEFIGNKTDEDQDYNSFIACCDCAYDNAYDTGERAGTQAVFSEVVDTVNDWLNKELDSIKSASDDAVEGTAETIEGVFTDIGTWLDDVLSDTAEDLSTASDLVFDAIGEQIDNLEQTVSPVIESIYDGFETSANKLETLFTDTKSSLYDIVTDAINSYDSFTNQISTSIEGYLSTAFSNIADVYDDVKEIISQQYEQAKQSVTDLYNLTSEEIVLIAQENYNYLNKLYDNIEISVSETLESATEEIDAAISSVGAVAKSFGQSVTDLMDFLNEGITPSLANLATASQSTLGIVESDENKDKADTVNSAYERMFNSVASSVGQDPKPLEAYKDATIPQTVLGSLLSAVQYVLSTGLLYIQMINLANSARHKDFLNKVMSENPVVDFSTSEALSLLVKEFITKEEATDAAKKDGINENKFEQLLKGAYQPVDIERSIHALWRGIITDDEFNQMGKRHGIIQKDLDTIRSVADIIPPVQDLVTMAVREVFSPELAAKFGLFEDLPEEFVTWAGKQGLNKEWAKRYWGAHWRLPAANMGFEMFHRRIIDEDTLDLLLKALDYSPAWRDKLKLLSYNVMTRVDLRRVYALGVIDREELVSRLRDYGYSPDDAELMARFYDVYTGIDDEEDDIDPRELTRTQLKKLLDLGTITDQEAVDEMIKIGYSSDMSQLLVKSWRDEDIIKEREDLINRYTRKAIREDLNESEVQALFTDLQVTNEELSRVKKVIAVERDNFDAIPSKAELKKMYEGGLINNQQWYTYMRRHGYSNEVIELYEKYYEF